MRVDIKYARGVRGMEHEETPIATETIKTMRIKSFWMNQTTPHPASTWRMRRLHSPGSHMLLICIPIFNPPLHNAAVDGYGDVVNIFILDCKKKVFLFVYRHADASKPFQRLPINWSTLRILNFTRIWSWNRLNNGLSMVFSAENIKIMRNKAF